MNPLLEVADSITPETAVIFDLDSTLFCVSPRTEAILRRLHLDPALRELFPREIDLLKDIEILPTDWGMENHFARTQQKPSDLFLRHIYERWAQHFFSSADLTHDMIYPAANEYVRSLHDKGAVIYYLTGRPEGAMREGTLRRLRDFKFPLEESRLIMKPLALESDENFKAQILQKIVGHHTQLWFFENEPVIIARVRQMLPQVRLVFMNSTHSGKAQAPQDLPTIGMDFRIGLR